MSPSIPITNHFVAIVQGENIDFSLKGIEAKAEELIEKLNLNVVERIAHEFPVQGITVVYLLSQSHMAIHTWPELNLVHLDLATCDLNAKREEEEIESLLAITFGGKAIAHKIEYN